MEEILNPLISIAKFLKENYLIEFFSLTLGFVTFVAAFVTIFLLRSGLKYNYKSLTASEYVLINNRKSELYFKMRDYYLDYLDSCNNYINLDVFEISDSKIKETGLKKEELIILYKIPLLAERALDFSKKFNQGFDLEDWEYWIKNWFERENFIIMWTTMKKSFRSNPDFIDFMEDCLREADARRRQ